MHRSGLKMEVKELDFEFEIINVQFNELGKYGLRLTVENPLLEGSGTGVQLWVNDGEKVYTNSGTTDIIEQTNLNEIYSFHKKKFVFRLPKGYCQNDKNHDVRLRIEAFRLTGTSTKNRKKEGEAFFAIYPRTNTPRINVFAKRNEDLYCFSDVMALLRAQEDVLAMHCGRMAYSVSFHEVRVQTLKAGAEHDPKPLSVIQEEDHPINPRLAAVPSPLPQLEIPPPPMVIPHQLIPSPTLRSPSPEGNPQDESVEEIDSEPPEESQPPIPVRGHAPTHRLPSDASLHLSSPNHTPMRSPEPLPHTHVTETPTRTTDVTGISPTNEWQVSRPGTECISIILHGATDLPALCDGSVPQPFGTAKSGSDEDKQREAQGITHATVQPTHSPSWEEKLTLEVDAETEEVLILSVADSRSKELLASYRVPVSYLQMFQHYHVELIQPHINVPSGVRLYATLVRKGSVIPRQEGFAFTGFEVLVRGLERPLKDPVGPLLVVARIVPNCESYINAMLMKTSRLASITATAVKYPNPPRSSFEVLDCTNHGYPQVSAAGYPQEQPNWNHSFLFQGRDCATAFTTGAALVLEYYSINTVMNSVSWHIRCPLGFSVVPLNQDIYPKLMAEHGRHGMRVDNLPVQGTSLQTVFNTKPTVGLILRLIGSERPDSILTALDPLHFPAMDWDENQQQAPSALQPPVHRTTSLQIGPSKEIVQSQTREQPAQSLTTPSVARPPVVKLQQDQGRLPPYDALAQILPEYNYLFSANHPSLKKPRPQQPTSKASHPLPTQQPALTSEERGPLTDERIENQEFKDHEAKEMDNYRTAMRKMAEDIIDLRKTISSLEVENSRLRSELSLHQDLGRTLLEDVDIDVMTKAEIADRIVSLKQKLAGESVELQSYKVKVHQLQNELIRKNDREKEMIILQKAYQQQQAVLQKYQEKGSRLKLLEDTICQQEKVIEKMEHVLDKKRREKPREKPGSLKDPIAIIDDSTRKEVELVLLAENARLREELQKLHHEPGPTVLQQPFHPVPDSFYDSEKLHLLAKLEKAQGRIQTLEAVMEENSRKWGQEKQDLLTRLSESQHGFARTSTMVLHDFPIKNISDSVLT